MSFEKNFLLYKAWIEGVYMTCNEKLTILSIISAYFMLSYWLITQ